MGSYNVACSVSHLSINCGDPVVYIPLTVAKYPSCKIGDTNNTLIYSECFYEPLTLPIFGEYDDYGRIAPTEDKNTEFLVSLGMNLKDIIDPEDSKALPDIGSGMFVHRKIYDVVKNKCSIDDDMGQRWMSKTKLRDEYKEFVADIKEAKKQAKMINDEGSVTDDVDWVKTMMVSNDHKTFNFRRWYKFRKIYNWDVIEQGILKNELIDFVIFTSGMYSVNRFFFPAMNGWQFGNPWATKYLNQTALNISKAEIKEYEDRN